MINTPEGFDARRHPLKQLFSTGTLPRLVVKSNSIPKCLRRNQQKVMASRLLSAHKSLLKAAGTISKSLLTRVNSSRSESADPLSPISKKPSLMLCMGGLSIMDKLVTVVTQRVPTMVVSWLLGI